VYPLMEKHLGAEGLKLADHDREKHQVRSELQLRIFQLTDYGSACQRDALNFRVSDPRHGRVRQNH
jgi:hypothetical protein